MVRTLLSLSAAAAIGVAATTAPGQSASGGHPDPLDAAASAPNAPYESALKGYRRLGEVKPTPWSDANDTVKRIGGWRAYAREANARAAPASAPATPPGRASGAESNKPTPDHSNHKH